MKKARLYSLLLLQLCSYCCFSLGLTGKFGWHTLTPEHSTPRPPRTAFSPDCLASPWCTALGMTSLWPTIDLIPGYPWLFESDSDLTFQSSSSVPNVSLSLPSHLNGTPLPTLFIPHLHLSPRDTSVGVGGPTSSTYG